MPESRHHYDLVDRILSTAAIVVAVSAVVVAVYEAKVDRQFAELSVWPYLKEYVTNNEDAYRLFVRNVGTGPALVRFVQMRVDGRPKLTWREVVTALIGQPPSELTIGSLQRGDVLLPGEPYRMLEIPLQPQGERVLEEQSRLSTRICYCSLYGSCWIRDSQSPEPAPVEACKANPGLEFRE